MNMTFEQFIDLLAPVFANNAAEINEFVLRSTFDCLFDQNSNGSIEKEEFQSLLTLLRAFNSNQTDLERKSSFDENNEISFQGQCTFIEFNREQCVSWIFFRIHWICQMWLRSRITDGLNDVAFDFLFDHFNKKSFLEQNKCEYADE